MNKNLFKKTVENIMGEDFVFSKEIKDTSDIYVALFENKEKNVIPNKIAIGINKHTGKTATSIKSLASIEDAIL